MKKLALFTAILVICGLTFATVIAREKPEKAPYKIGAVIDVTGGASGLGEPEKQTLEMLAEELNAKGGINGHKIEMIIYDNESDPTKAVTKAKKLVNEDKVIAVIGATQSGTTFPIIPIVVGAKIPLVSVAASWKIVTDPDTKQTRPWVFKTAQSDSLAVSKIYDYLNKNKISKVALITVSNGFGDSGRGELLRLAPEFKINIVADERFGEQDADMTAQLTKIKGTDAQAVICWCIQKGPAIVAKNFKDLGMTQKLIMSHGIANQKFLDLAGDAANGIILPAGRLIVAEQLPLTDPQRKILLDYKSKFEAKFSPAKVSTFGGHAYDAFMILTNALKKAGPEPEKLRAEIEKTKNFAGCGGIFNMGPDDHEGLTKDAFVMVEIKGGKWELLK